MDVYYVMKYIKDEGIVGKFEQLSLDAETDMFIKRSIERSDWMFTQLYHNFAKVLNKFRKFQLLYEFTILIKI